MTGQPQDRDETLRIEVMQQNGGERARCKVWRNGELVFSGEPAGLALVVSGRVDYADLHVASGESDG